MFPALQVERIVGNTFAKNIVLSRYFPDDSRGSLLAAILRLGFEESQTTPRTRADCVAGSLVSQG